MLWKGGDGKRRGEGGEMVQEYFCIIMKWSEEL